MEAKEYAESVNGDCIEAFMELLNDKIYRAKDMLIERFDYICSQSPESAKFMYENGVMEGYNNKIKVLKRIAFGFRNFDNFKTRILLLD